MSQPKIVHCICPQRHFLVGLMVQDDCSDEHAIALMRQKVQRALCSEIDGSCGICGAQWQLWQIEVIVKEEDRGAALAALDEYKRTIAAESRGEPAPFFAQEPGKAGRN